MMDIPELVDVEFFIREVEKHPEIWNLQSEVYNDKAKKKSAWLEVCQVSCVGFNEKNDKEKGFIRNTLAKKWRNIKDTYLKTLKKKRAGFRCRKYVYANQLHFVKEAYFNPETESDLLEGNQDISDDECSNLTSAAEFLQNQDDDSSPSPSPNKNANRKRKGSIEQKPHIPPLEPPLKIGKTVSFAPPINTAPGHVEPNEQHLISGSVQPTVSPNQAFFNCILPIVDGFTDDEIVDFRLDVLNVIKRMQNARRFQNDSKEK